MRLPDKLDARDQPSISESVSRKMEHILHGMKEKVMDILFFCIAVRLFVLSGLLIRLLEKV